MRCYTDRGMGLGDTAACSIGLSSTSKSRLVRTTLHLAALPGKSSWRISTVQNCVISRVLDYWSISVVPVLRVHGIVVAVTRGGMISKESGNAYRTSVYYINAC